MGVPHFGGRQSWKDDTSRIAAGLSNNKIVTLQLCVGTNCLILQLFRPHASHSPFLKLISWMMITKVTLFRVNIYIYIYINENASKLHREYGIIKCGGISSSSNTVPRRWIDIRALAKTCSLKGIAYKVVRLSMRKRGNKKWHS